MPQVEGSACTIAYWLWVSCLLQIVLFVASTSTQALLHLFHALPLQAWFCPPGRPLVKTAACIGDTLGAPLLLIFLGPGKGGPGNSWPQTADCWQLEGLLQVFGYYTLLPPFADEVTGAWSCKQVRNFSGREMSRCQDRGKRR